MHLERMIKRFVLMTGLFVLFQAQAASDNGGLREFGVAYYPEAWPEERWETDLRMMQELGINLIRIGEFNWSNFEPTEGVFDFKPYLRLLDRCTKYGIDVMMCTPTAATPKWMQADYPETEKTRADGTKPGCGIRQSSCATNAKFRFFARRAVERMAEAFKDHPAVTLWQLDNELNIYGATGECNCQSCEAAYREDLKRRYGTLEKLNKEFNGAFWSSRFTKWEDVRLPIDHRRTGWKRDYVRFIGEQFLSYTLEQAAILRKANPKWRITSNNPSCSNIMRHDLLHRDLGEAAADTYCHSSAPGCVAVSAWTWTSFRGLTGSQRPFMIGETGPFCFDTDSDYSFEMVKPWFWLMIGHGAESVVYFRWRMSVAGEETHGAVLPWDGKKTFVYDMLKKQMNEYRALPESIARLPLDRSDVAIVHDAASHIYTLSMAVSFKCPDRTMDTEVALLSALERRGVKTDIVQLADDMDLDAYRVVFLPLCFSVSDALAAKLRDYVAKGGALVAVNRLNFCSPLGGGYYPETGPVGFADLFGVEIHERRSISYGNVEHAEPLTAETVLKLGHGCFKNGPLLTRRGAGKGSAWYCTRTLDYAAASEVVSAVMRRTGIEMRAELPEGVARMTRGNYVIIVNYNPEPRTIAAEAVTPLLGEPVVHGGRMTLAPYGVAVYRFGQGDVSLRDRIHVWGYQLDRTPTACPFVFGKTSTSLDTAVRLFGAKSAIYMNSMFNRGYIEKYFPNWDRECFANCIDTRLSDAHFAALGDVPEVWCALEHLRREDSAKEIARLSLKYPNIAGINIDDFNDSNPQNAMTPEALAALRRTIKAINPKLRISIVTYAERPGATFDVKPYAESVDMVSRWKWEADTNYWSNFRTHTAALRKEVGDRVKIVQGLYLHDFGKGMESRDPLPFEVFTNSVTTAVGAVREGYLDGVILPQVGWYSSPRHACHVSWLRKAANGETRAAIAMPRYDWAAGCYLYAQNEMRRAVKGKDFDFVIFGDSLTMGWLYPESDKDWPGGREIWDRHFGHLRTANFGVSGDRTEHVLWRIEREGQADGWTAKRIYLMIGSNNSHQVREGDDAVDTPEQALAGTQAIIEALKARHPESEIVVFGILPREGNLRDWGIAYNRLLGTLEDGKVRFKDISAAFLAPDGHQAPGLFRDRLHPLPAGYEIWATAIEQTEKGEQ